MKKINSLLFLCAITAMGFGVKAQNTVGKMEDAGALMMIAYVPEQQVDKLSATATNALTNKLRQIISANGLAGGEGKKVQFIMTANLVVTTKDITPTAPPMTALNVDVNLYIGDGFSGTLFSSKTVSVKGVGSNETKAYMDAIKNIRASDPSYATFIEEGKTKIMKYYNTKCDIIIKEAQSLASRNEYEAAIYNLASVPDVCKECYEKCLSAIAPIYKQKVEKDCKVKLGQANNIWNANQDINAANAAGDILTTIDPDASCFKDAQALANKISNRVKEIDKREWNYTLKSQMQESERIKAYRDVGVAYGNGQPKSVTYNVSGWW